VPINICLNASFVLEIRWRAIEFLIELIVVLRTTENENEGVRQLLERWRTAIFQ
jgi:hypothetical protein